MTAYPPPTIDKLASYCAKITVVDRMKLCNYAVYKYKDVLAMYDKNQNKKISYDECLEAYQHFKNKLITELQYQNIWNFYVYGGTYK